MKITPALHARLEDIFKALNYTLRYEKGSFKSGWCILEEKSVIVINKFFSLEGKVNAMIEILREIVLDMDQLDGEQQKLVQKLRQTELKF